MSDKKVHLSIVSAEYMGAAMVDELVSRIKANVEPLTSEYDIILVNDASPDNTWPEICRVCAADSHVKGVNLSRNFGEQYAITAGLSFAKGDYVVVMDCDLQNRPEDIPLLYRKAMEGYDIVYAQRVEKRFGFWKKLSSRMFHFVLHWMSGMSRDSSVAEFGIYSQRVVKEYNKLPEIARSFNSLVSNLGFRSTAVPVTHAERGEGESSYTLGKLFRMAGDVILSNSNKPLKIMVHAGLVMVLFAVVLVVYSVVEHYCANLPQGFSSLFISIWLVGGFNILALGVVGLYIDKIFNQVKGRPLFIVSDTVNVENDR